MKRKDKVDPYAYIPLKNHVLNKRYGKVWEKSTGKLCSVHSM